VVKILDLIFFARPILLIPAWTVYLHYGAACRSPGYIGVYPDGAAGVHLAILTLITAAAYVFNQIFDIASDRANDKLYFLPRNIITLPTAWIYYAFLTIAGLSMSVLVEPGILPASAALVSLGILYSAPVIRMKDRPLAGLLANAAAFGLLIPWMAARTCPEAAVSVRALPYFLAVAAGYVLTTIPDRAGDAATGKRTVAVILGQTGSLWLAVILALSTTFVSLWLGNYEMAATAFVTVIGAGCLVASFNAKWLIATSKLPILVLTVFAAVHFPLYFIILLLTIVLTRLYYNRRFGIIYPKMG